MFWSKSRIWDAQSPQMTLILLLALTQPSAARISPAPFRTRSGFCLVLWILNALRKSSTEFNTSAFLLPLSLWFAFKEKKFVFWFLHQVSNKSFFLPRLAWAPRVLTSHSHRLLLCLWFAVLYFHSRPLCVSSFCRCCEVFCLTTSKRSRMFSLLTCSGLFSTFSTTALGVS